MQPGKYTTSSGLTDVLVHLCQHQQTHTNTVHEALGLYTVLASLERQGERRKERIKERKEERKKDGRRAGRKEEFRGGSRAGRK